MVFFFMDFVAELWEPLEFLGPWTVFHYYNPTSIVQQGTVPWDHALVLIAVAAAGYAAAIAVFQHRDIP